MKKIVLAGLVAFVVFSFKGADVEKKEVKTDQSKVVWKGYKVTGEHEGTVDLKAGTLTFEGNKLTGGNFVIDMTTIGATDLEGEWKVKLDGHLKSNDFFGVEQHPTATFKITKAE